ncbi:MAG TPA: HEAT repeat domain-containing protein [Roseiflexaceae bacterium]|nr:HEAT repeat domain-containing protein [Roseiflexaceae bacterium]HMP42481.1 HEAT repeat domain-containing protein [Roseiflexaceae bacterium]
MTTPPPHDPTDDREEQDIPEEHAGETTRVGKAVGELVRPTRNLPVLAETRTSTAQAAALRERIAMLIAALGDPEHPLHQRASVDLIALGEPAVPALCEVLQADNGWLQAFRATELLGQIGDGRAAGPLLDALRHPNSNVRWGAVRSLAVVGDARAFFELRRVAAHDRGKTSWGEPVAGAARSALEQMQGRNILLRGADLLQTSLACVVMLVALTFAWSVVTAVREELQQVGIPESGGALELPPIVRTALPTEIPEVPTPLPTPLPIETVEAVVEEEALLFTGAVLSAGNVRSSPAREPDNVIGLVSEGDDIVFVATSTDFQWYRIRLGERFSAASRIQSDDGSGWVNRSLLTQPPADVPIDETLVGR